MYLLFTPSRGAELEDLAVSLDRRARAARVDCNVAPQVKKNLIQPKSIFSRTENNPMRHAYSLAIAALAIAGLQLSGCGKSSSYTKVEPAKVEKVDGINKVTLTEKAMERIGVKTAPLLEGKIEGAANATRRGHSFRIAP